MTELAHNPEFEIQGKEIITRSGRKYDAGTGVEIGIVKQSSADIIAFFTGMIGFLAAFSVGLNGSNVIVGFIGSIAVGAISWYFVRDSLKNLIAT